MPFSEELRDRISSRVKLAFEERGLRVRELAANPGVLHLGTEVSARTYIYAIKGNLNYGKSFPFGTLSRERLGVLFGMIGISDNDAIVRELRQNYADFHVRPYSLERSSV